MGSSIAFTTYNLGFVVDYIVTLKAKLVAITPNTEY